ncbi:MAG: MBL fold metallo-hydrolase [Clostridia bacterium]|nr:MBL fold metallo-hydrolase [Clostridia bacterium]
MKVCTLVSGSSGNSTYISDGTTSVLVDAGVTGKRIEAELAAIGVSPTDIDAIFITHEHVDHIAGIGVLARRYGIPIFANYRTMCWLKYYKKVEKIPEERLVVFENDTELEFKTLKVRPFSIPHDAADPVGYRFTSGGVSVAVSTDIGEVTDNIKRNVKGCAVVVLEANHDVEMLKKGPYTYLLKKRILGDHGHLSNDVSASFARELAENGTETIILGHLSAENNTPELALKTVRQGLEGQETACACRVLLAPRHSHGEIITC